MLISPELSIEFKSIKNYDFILDHLENLRAKEIPNYKAF